MLSEAEIRAIANTVVQRAKETARVDQGTLKRSIAYTYVKDVVTFRQIYYGQYGDNSQLEKIARDLMPNGIEYRIIFTDFGGGTVEVTRTRTGRRSQTSTLANVIKNNSPKIRALIGRVLAKKKKKDGEKD